MNASKSFLTGTLIVALFMAVPAMSGVPGPAFPSGDVEEDFNPAAYPGILVITDPGGGELEVDDPEHPDPPPPGTHSGWDIKDLRLAYDAANDTLYVGLNSYGMVGDVDGDGNPGFPAKWGGGSDLDHLGGTETVAVYFDLDMSGPWSMATSWDVIVGVGSGIGTDMLFSDFGIYKTVGSSSPSNNFQFPSTVFPTGRILGHDGDPPLEPSMGADPVDPSDDINDWEFSITNFSTLLFDAKGIVDVDPAQFRVGAFMGSIQDGDIGEDYIYYHQVPSTVVTITSSKSVVMKGDKVSLIITEENAGIAMRSQQDGPVDMTRKHMELPLSSVEVEVTQNGAGLPWSPLGPPPDDGDGPPLDVLNGPVPEPPSPPIIGETWTWGTTTVLMSDVINDFTTFVARGSGIDLLGFKHTFEEDAGEQDSVSVEPISLSTIVTITPSATKVLKGDTVDLTITETNDGEEDLESVVVAVTQNGVPLPPLGPPDSGDDPPVGVLNVDEQWVWVRTSNPILDPDNPTEFVAIGSAVYDGVSPPLTVTWCDPQAPVPPPEEVLCDDQERATATVGCAELSTIVTIEPSPTMVPIGSTVELKITEKNDGKEDLKSVVVAVTQNGVPLPPLGPPDSGDTSDPGVLNVDEQWVWIRTSNPILDPDNPTQFVAIGSAVYDGISPAVTVTWCDPQAPVPPPEEVLCDDQERASALCYPISPSTVIDIKANGSDGPITIGVGDPVTLTICEQNNSSGTVDVPLTNVGVEVYYDNGSGEIYLTTLLAPPDSGDTSDPGVLNVGEIWCWDYVVPSLSVDTTFIAYGYGEYIVDGLITIVTWCQGEPPQVPEVIIVCDEDERDEVPVITESAGCRLTGGGVDEEYSPEGVSAQDDDGDRATFGGQAGANTALPPQPKGEWTHHQQKGPHGAFTFHGGTASSPAGTEIIEIRCSDPGGCKPSGDPPSPAKQLDFDGIGTFKNFGSRQRAPVWLFDGANAKCGSQGGKWRFDGTFHYFQVNADDNGEPGNKNLDAASNPEVCPPNGFGEKGDLLLADCRCADFYRITIYDGVDADKVKWLDSENIDPSSLNMVDVIYEFHGYIDGGNLQIHRLTGYDLNP